MSGKRTFDHAYIVKLWRQGLSSNAIKERLGCHDTTIATALAEAGIERCKEKRHQYAPDTGVTFSSMRQFTGIKAE